MPRLPKSAPGQRHNRPQLGECSAAGPPCCFQHTRARVPGCSAAQKADGFGVFLVNGKKHCFCPVTARSQARAPVSEEANHHGLQEALKIPLEALCPSLDATGAVLILHTQPAQGDAGAEGPRGAAPGRAMLMLLQQHRRPFRGEHRGHQRGTAEAGPRCTHARSRSSPCALLPSGPPSFLPLSPPASLPTCPSPPFSSRLPISPPPLLSRPSLL